MLLSHSYKVSLVRSVVVEAVVLGASVLEMAVTIRLLGDVRIESDGEKFEAKRESLTEMPIRIDSLYWETREQSFARCNT